MARIQRSEEDLKRLMRLVEGSDKTDLIPEILNTALKLIEDGTTRGDLKIINSALKELRYSFKIFSPYRNVRKISIFGSARTHEEEPEYKMAKEFAGLLAKAGWMTITGAASGIMKAGHEGAGRDRSFGVNIRLPFEQRANIFIENDPKLINFKYFFTRKLIFIKESDAIALFPGGFGTHDEGFEALTLVQTGKCPPRPIVMVAPPKNPYWKEWEQFIQEHLLKKRLISPEDLNLFKITDSAETAAQEVLGFYKIYHSSRFVGEEFVMRLNKAISDETIEKLNKEFADLSEDGKIISSSATPEESNEPELIDLPRLIFHFNCRDWGRLRQMIDFINASQP
jgi:uncharacterized protein (TIGR00730 family)